MIKYIVTGTRSLQQLETIQPILTHYLTSHNPGEVLLIHGGCKGVDQIARNYAITLGIQTKEYKADWNKYEIAAGPIRNRQMLGENIDAVVIAFPSSASKGTVNCINQAQRMGMRVDCYHLHDV